MEPLFFSDGDDCEELLTKGGSGEPTIYSIEGNDLFGDTGGLGLPLSSWGVYSFVLVKDEKIGR